MEGSARLFASEFSRTTLSVPGSPPNDPPFIITPTGARCRNLFVTGVLTEIDERAGMILFRVSDPTGAFGLSINDRQQKIAEVVKELAVPSFVSVLGSVHTFRSGESVRAVLRPESVRAADRAERDRWILATADHTLDRLLAAARAIGSGTGDEAILMAIRHYALTREMIREFSRMVEEAAAGVAASTASAKTQPPAEEITSVVMGIIRERSGIKGIAVEDVIARAAEAGIGQDATLAAIGVLVTEDECYQPQKGFVKPL
jgi:RPA family protein